MKIINPANDELIQEFPEDNKETILSKYKRARNAQPKWAKASITERLEKIKTFKQLLSENVEELARTLTLETGKPISQSRGEVLGACKKIDFFLNESEKVLKETHLNTDGNTKEIISYDPLGVICNISAWNYPYLVGVNIFIPALICGNTVLYKPSEFSTLTGEHIASLLYKAGIPEDVFIPVYGEGDVGKILCELNFDGYFFTGSYKTGKAIANAVSDKLVPVGLELGGKDPLYVTNEIDDIKAVSEAVAEGCFYNNGQSCCATERVYVHKDIYDSFITHFIEASKKWTYGDPTKEETMSGAITRKPHLNFLKELTSDALNKGAVLQVGGELTSEKGSFFPTTVFTNVNHSMKLMKEEAFGPIRGVMKVENDQEAIELMNDTEYGLTASVFSKNIDRARKILNEVHSGTSYINCCDRVSGYLPWAGRKNSGLGASLSHLGLFAFCNPRGIHLRE